MFLAKRICKDSKDDYIFTLFLYFYINASFLFLWFEEIDRTFLEYSYLMPFVYGNDTVELGRGIILRGVKARNFRRGSIYKYPQNISDERNYLEYHLNGRIRISISGIYRAS